MNGQLRKKGQPVPEAARWASLRQYIADGLIVVEPDKAEKPKRKTKKEA